MAELLQSMLDGPAGTPPVGELPHLKNSQNLNAVFISSLALALTFGTLAVVMRMYTKMLIIQSLSHEDYAITLGWVLNIAGDVLSVIGYKNGAGFHMWDINLKTFFRSLYWTNLSLIFYCPAIFLIKLSIFLQYLRIFVPSRIGNTGMLISTHFFIWVCVAVYLAFFILAVVQCIPRAKIRHPLTVPGHCLNSGAVYLTGTVFNAVTDIAILILPMPSLWTLNLPTKKKFSIVAIFATGSAACIISTLRIYYGVLVLKSRDISYNLSKLAFLTYAESAIGAIVSCAPVSPRFIRHLRSKLHGTSSPSELLGIPLHRARPFSDQGLPRIPAQAKTSPFLAHEQPGLSEAWSESLPPLVQARGHYFTVLDRDMVRSTKHTTNCQPSEFGAGEPTRRDDFENRVGGYGYEEDEIIDPECR